MSQWSAETVRAARLRVRDSPSARWTVPPIFSSKRSLPREVRAPRRSDRTRTRRARRAPSSIAEHLAEEVLAARGCRLDHLAALEAQPHVLDARRPRTIAGKVKRIVALDAVSTGPVKTSPSGKLVLPSQEIQVRPPTPSGRSVSSADDPQLRDASRANRPTSVEPLAERRPGRDGIVRRRASAAP